jgi:hypothetical protein
MCQEVHSLCFHLRIWVPKMVWGCVGKEGKNNLTRSGVAQTTMASMEIVRELGRQQGQNRLVDGERNFF